MNFEEELDILKDMSYAIMKRIDALKSEMRDTATMNAIRSDIHRLSLHHKDAITIREASERSGIPVQTLYRYRDKELLKVKEGENAKEIILVEDWISFLTGLPDAKRKR